MRTLELVDTGTEGWELVVAASSLLGAAVLLAADTSWSGTVHFVFQPAEEGYALMPTEPLC